MSTRICNSIPDCLVDTIRIFSLLLTVDTMEFGLIVIIPVFWTGLFLIFLGPRTGHIRVAFCQASIATLLFCALSTELASAFKMISAVGLFAIWTGAAFLIGAIVLRTVPRPMLRQNVPELRRRLATMDWGHWLLVALTGFILVSTLIIAMFSAPNTFDSMTYHMARVPHWIQQQSVDFYPTENARQNYMAPLAEYSILHLQLLSQSDRFANLVQWASFVLSIVSSSLIAKEFDQSGRVQWLTAGITAAIPMAIMQATSTQNDLVVGALCLCFALFLLRFLINKSPVDAVFCSAALGLALLAKTTGYFYCCGIGLCLTAGYFLSQDPLTTKVRMGLALVAVVVCAILINTNHVYRNMTTYGSPFSNVQTRRFVSNQRISGTVLYSNIVRNAALHLGGNTDGKRESTYRAIELLLGDELNHPDTTFPGCKFEIRFLRHEDFAGNFWHLLLAPVACVVFCCRQGGNRGLRIGYVASLLMGCLIFCAILKWQIWGSRLQTPLFLLASPVMAIAVTRILRDNPIAISFIAVLLLYSSFDYVTKNVTRPLKPIDGKNIFNTSREEQYFQSQPDLLPVVESAVRAALLQKPSEIGLLLGGDDWEYPIWRMAGKASKNVKPEFRSLSRSLANQESGGLPEIIIVSSAGDRSLLRGKHFETIFESDRLYVIRIRD